MLKEVKRYEWDGFLAAVRAHYEQLGYEPEITPRLGTDGFRTFRLTRKDDGTSRALDNPEAYRELAGILFPGEALSVISVHKPKEAFLGNDHVYIAVEPLTGEENGK